MPALRRRLGWLAILAAVFALFSAAVAAGDLRGGDRGAAAALARIWNPALLPLFDGIALLGGLELTALLAALMAGYLAWRRRREAWAALALPIAVGLESVYKQLIHHLGPPAPLAHPDGPSLSVLFAHTTLLRDSFPSGHVTRAVVVYGLLAYLIRRLVARPAVRIAAEALAALLVLAVSFDRLYLEVHWESDVIGGLLLGGVCLLGAIVWVELPGGDRGERR